MRWKVLKCYPGMDPIVEREVEVPHKLDALYTESGQLKSPKPFSFPTFEEVFVFSKEEKE